MTFVPLMERPRVKAAFAKRSRARLRALTFLQVTSLVGLGITDLVGPGSSYVRVLGVLLIGCGVWTAGLTLLGIRQSNRHLKAARATSLWSGFAGVRQPWKWNRPGSAGVVSVIPGGISWTPIVFSKRSRTLTSFAAGWDELGSRRLEPGKYDHWWLTATASDGNVRQLVVRDGEGLQVALDAAAPAIATAG